MRIASTNPPSKFRVAITRNRGFMFRPQNSVEALILPQSGRAGGEVHRGPAMSPPATHPRELLELAQVDSLQLRIVRLIGGQQLVPGHFPSAVGGLTPQDGAERCFGPHSRLIVKFAAGNAFNESLLLFRVGLFEGVGRN